MNCWRGCFFRGEKGGHRPVKAQDIAAGRRAFRQYLPQVPCFHLISSFLSRFLCGSRAPLRARKNELFVVLVWPTKQNKSISFITSMMNFFEMHFNLLGVGTGLVSINHFVYHKNRVKNTNGCRRQEKQFLLAFQCQGKDSDGMVAFSCRAQQTRSTTYAMRGGWHDFSYSPSSLFLSTSSLMVPKFYHHRKRRISSRYM